MKETGKEHRIDGSEPEDKAYRKTPAGIAAANRYSDIIHREEPLLHHPRMDLSQRAKIFSPYDALRGFDEDIADENDRIREVQRVELSEEETAHLSEALKRLRKGMKVSALVFEADPDSDEDRGHYVTIRGTVLRVDPAGGFLELEKDDNTKKSTGKVQKHPPVILRFEDLLDLTIPEC